MSYENIPDEIKQYPQWINWKYVELIGNQGVVKQTKEPVRTRDGYRASTINPLDWTTFERAVAYAVANNVGLGFVFTKNDPFFGFDLDDAEGDAAVIAQQQDIYRQLPTYSEWSPSGKGLHIIGKGSLPGKGKHPKHFGLFDNERFFTFTGNVLFDAPIADCNDALQTIYAGLHADSGEAIEFIDPGNQQHTDDEVLSFAKAAVNGDKFARLWAGDWRTDYGHCSSSDGKSCNEADFALCNILGFYSRNLAQTIRLFKASAFGQRDKAKRNSYVEKMAKRAFDRMIEQVTIPEGNTPNVWFDARKVTPWAGKLAPEPVAVTAWQALPNGQAHFNAPVNYTAQPLVTGYDTPIEFAPAVPPPVIPGLLGELVSYCWNSAPYQVAEVALASGLSLMALLAGRSYCYETMGLQLYLLVLSKTSLGKSFMYSSNDRVMGAIKRHFRSLPPSLQHMGKARLEHVDAMITTEPGSAQGLAHHIPNAPSTLLHCDEYVDKIRIMAQPNPPPHMALMRGELLNLVEMSGPGRVYRARKYSVRGPSAEGVDVPAASVSMLASGTPAAFYDELTPTLLSSGFLPRFTILEYSGSLTKKNERPQLELQPETVSRLMTLLDISYNKSLTITAERQEFIPVKLKDEQAAARLKWFEDLTRSKVWHAHQTGSNVDGMWSRALANVCKIASLIAIGCNPHNPLIDASHIDLAINIVSPSIRKIEAMVSNGEVGNGDDKLEADMKHIILKMLHGGWFLMKGYTGAKRAIIDAGYIQLSLLRNLCMKRQSFKLSRIGASNAFENTLNALAKYKAINLVDVNGVRCAVPDLSYFPLIDQASVPD